MRNDPEDIETLEAYVEGRMDTAQQRDFEQRLAGDTDLAMALDRYRRTRAAIVEHHRDEDVRALLQRIETRERKRGSTWTRYAAAAAMLIASVSILFVYMGRTSLPGLAEELRVQEAPLPVLMGSEDIPRRSLDRSMQLFGTARYAEARDELSKLQPSDTVRFYRGLCSAALEVDPSADLSAVMDDTASVYRAKAMYHLMLWKMRNGDRGQAKRLFDAQQGLVEHPYREQLEALARTNILAD